MNNIFQFILLWCKEVLVLIFAISVSMLVIGTLILAFMHYPLITPIGFIIILVFGTTAHDAYRKTFRGL